jgi:hypothetical protein
MIFEGTNVRPPIARARHGGCRNAIRWLRAIRFVTGCLVLRDLRFGVFAPTCDLHTCQARAFGGRIGLPLTKS